MLLIGLGKQAGAEVYHSAIQDYSFAEIVRSVAGEVFRHCRILAGLAIVENAHEQTARIEALPPEEFERREKELLVLARQWMARLPFSEADLLLVDRIGKNISGTGMDTNVIGRKFDDHKAVEGEQPRVRIIAVRGLTPETHGNAIGLGLAEFCKSQVLRETDFAATRLNGITAAHVSAAMVPLDYETDRQMIEMALRAAGQLARREAKILWIANTLDLVEVECSAAYLEAARGRTDLELLTGPRELPFDAVGNLPDLRAWASM